MLRWWLDFFSGHFLRAICPCEAGLHAPTELDSLLIVTLLASRLVYLCQNQDIVNKNILLVVPDSIAPRVFETKKVINQMAGGSSEAVAEAITGKIIKSWMPQAWIDALGNFALAMVAAVCDCKANVDAIKKSELHERTLVDCYDVKEGDKITVLKGGFIKDHEGARTSGYVKPGEYTVIDRSYEKNGEVIPQFSISRWELFLCSTPLRSNTIWYNIYKGR